MASGIFHASPGSLIIAFCFRLLFHLLAETERPHVGPDFLDVSQTFFLRAALAGVVPAKRILPVGGPDRVLLLMVDDHFVDGVVFSVVTHTYVSFVLNGVKKSSPNSLLTLREFCTREELSRKSNVFRARPFI